MKNTKIVCTIGPASEKKTILEKLAKAGMNVARLNFSHGTYQNHAMLIKNLRAIAKKLKQPIAIMQDLQGPKIRVGELSSTGVKLIKGQSVVLSTGVEEYNEKEKIIPVPFAELHRVVRRGEAILLDDGLLELKVAKIKGKKIICKVVYGGILFSHKGINIPDAKVRIPSLTVKDIKDLEFGIKNDVDWVAISFVQHAQDIAGLRRLITKYEKKYFPRRLPSERAKIIAKIEKKQAVENFAGILEAADGIMVARGDLGIETPIQNIPLLQKEMIGKSLVATKPVITATQMLDSMVRHPRPTRAEVTDVANAVIDHTDAVMLSAESATGKYPVKAVEIMSKIINDTEESSYDDLALENITRGGIEIDTAVSSVAARLLKNVGAKAVLVATISGYTARLVSRYRPEKPIIVAAETEKVRRQLALSWGVVPYVVKSCRTVDELITEVVKIAKRERVAKQGDRVIIIGGQPVGKAGNANLIKIHEVE